MIVVASISGPQLAELLPVLRLHSLLYKLVVTNVHRTSLVVVGSAGDLLSLKDMPVKAFEDVLASVDLRRRPVQALAGKSKVPGRLVHLDWPLAIVRPGQCALDEHVE